jgi:addiction module HigA family antidote
MAIIFLLVKIKARFYEKHGPITDLNIYRMTQFKEVVMNSTYALKNPCHPGAFVRRNIVEPRNLTVMAAAALIGVTRQALSDLLNEKTSLSAEMALRLEKAFGFKMESMMEMQKQFDIAKVRKRELARQSQIKVQAKAQERGRLRAFG